MSQLSAKFIERTRGEAATVRELAERARGGDATAFEQLNYLVHRIHGGGATFGFPEVGTCAREIERMIEPAVRQGVTFDAQILEQLVAKSLRLEEEVRKAAP
jgi:chemotaxis protein histidine kinase CheA